METPNYFIIKRLTIRKRKVKPKNKMQALNNVYAKIC